MKRIMFYPLSVLLISFTGIIFGQENDSRCLTTETLPEASQKYFFPDLNRNALIADGKRLRFKPIIAIVTDYNWFWQDDPSLEQVGLQENTFDLRAARFGMNLRNKGKLKWDFTFTADYQESRTREEEFIQVYDFKLLIPIGPISPANADPISVQADMPGVLFRQTASGQ